jgi:DNA-binding XRE family transcriptional regulator
LNLFVPIPKRRLFELQKGALATDRLKGIHEEIRIPKVRLAEALSVSRQAIYAWKAGKPTDAENAERVKDILRSSDLFARGGLKSDCSSDEPTYKQRKEFLRDHPRRWFSRS